MNHKILEEITNQDYSVIATRIQDGLKQSIEETDSKELFSGLVEELIQQ